MWFMWSMLMTHLTKLYLRKSDTKQHVVDDVADADGNRTVDHYSTLVLLEEHGERVHLEYSMVLSRKADIQKGTGGTLYHPLKDFHRINITLPFTSCGFSRNEP